MRQLKPGEIITSDPKVGEAGIPDIFVNEVLDVLPMAEMTDQFNTLRNWEEMHKITGAGKGIKIGVGDTGVDKQHMQGDLKGTIAKDFTNSRYGFYDRHGHGSHTTSTIGGRKNGEGYFGAAYNAQMYHAKMLGDSGSGGSRGIYNGIKWMVDQGCHIINLSLGSPGFSQEIENGLIYAQNNGCLVFASMGNSGNRGDGHPGNSRNSEGITAMDYNKRLASFSSRSRMAKYVGYGVNVLACVTNGKYSRMSGTSMSCPDQVGQAGNIFSLLLKLGLPLPKTVAQFDALVEGCIEDLGPDGKDVGYGLGFIDTWKVIRKIQAMAPTDPDPVDPVDPTPSPEKLNYGLVSTSDGLFFMGGTGEKCTLTVGDKSYEGKALEIT